MHDAQNLLLLATDEQLTVLPVVYRKFCEDIAAHPKFPQIPWDPNQCSHVWGTALVLFRSDDSSSLVWPFVFSSQWQDPPQNPRAPSFRVPWRAAGALALVLGLLAMPTVYRSTRFLFGLPGHSLR